MAKTRDTPQKTSTAQRQRPISGGRYSQVRCIVRVLRRPSILLGRDQQAEPWPGNRKWLCSPTPPASVEMFPSRAVARHSQRCSNFAASLRGTPPQGEYQERTEGQATTARIYASYYRSEGVPFFPPLTQ